MRLKILVFIVLSFVYFVSLLRLNFLPHIWAITTGENSQGEITTEQREIAITESNFHEHIYAGTTEWEDTTYDGCSFLPSVPTPTPAPAE